MRLRIVLLASWLIVSSCIDESQYDIRQVAFSPTLAFPVAFGYMGIVDMLSSRDSAYIRAYPDSLLYLYYAKTLGSTDIRDRFQLPDNNTSNYFDLPAGTLPASANTTVIGTINKQIDLGLTPALLTEILLKGGTLNHSVTLTKTTTPANLPVEATVTFLDIKHKTTQQPLVITQGNGSNSTSLVDYVISTVNNQFPVKIDFVIKPHPTTSIAPNTKADVHLGFSGMQFAYIKGFLGDQAISLPPQSLDISVFSKLLQGAAVSFVQPNLTLRAVNDYGVPCEVNFSVLRAAKGATTLAIQISPSNPVTINAPATLGTSATTNISITNQQAVINFGPDKLEYTASARINKGLSSGTNFLADTSKLRVSMITEIPLYGKLSGITVTDTLDVHDLGELKKADVLNSSLKVSAQNELPLDAFVQIYFMDASYVIQDSLFSTNQTYLVKASEVTPAGDLQHAGVTDLKFGLEPAKLTKLFDAHFLFIKARMSSAKDSNGAQLNVKFRSSYRLKLNVGILAQINVKAQ